MPPSFIQFFILCIIRNIGYGELIDCIGVQSMIVYLHLFIVAYLFIYIYYLSKIQTDYNMFTIMELYTVEKIVGKRFRKGGIIEYKVKWLNYDDQDCTWQPLKNLQYVEDMVRVYEQENSKVEKEQKRQMRPRTQVDYKLSEEEQVAYNEDYQQEQNQLNVQTDQYEGNTEDKLGESYEQQDGTGDKDQQPQNKKTQCANWDDDQVPDFDIQLQSLSFDDDEELKTREQIEKTSAPRKIYKHQEQQKQIRKTPEKPIQKPKPKKPIQQEQKKSYLQQVQQRTRFIVKAPPKKKSSDQIPRSPKPGELKVLQISRCNKTNQFIYLTQFGQIITYRRQADMKRLFADQLIRFYQSRIEFAKIPKLSK